MLAAMINPMPPALPVRLPSAVRASLTGRRAWRTAMAGVARTLDPWLPRVCALCESALALSGAGLCRHCRLGLPGRQRPRCARCGLGRPDSSACPACEQTAFAFDATCVLADYAPPLDRLIGALKFGGQLAAASALGQEMARALRHRQTSPAPEQLPPIDLIVAVPLSVIWSTLNGRLDIAPYVGAKLLLFAAILLCWQLLRTGVPRSRLYLATVWVGLLAAALLGVTKPGAPPPESPVVSHKQTSPSAGLFIRQIQPD